MDLGNLGDTLALAMLGLLVIGLVYLTREIQTLREQLEPLTTSPLARGFAAIGS